MITIIMAFFFALAPLMSRSMRWGIAGVLGILFEIVSPFPFGVFLIMLSGGVIFLASLESLISLEEMEGWGAAVLMTGVMATLAEALATRVLLGASLKLVFAIFLGDSAVVTMVILMLFFPVMISRKFL